MSGNARRWHHGRMLAAALLLVLAACEATTPDRPRATPGTAQATRSGLPQHNALFQATGLPAGAVYSVSRTSNGFRVLYYAQAGTTSERVARNLCATLGRPAATVRTEAIDSAHRGSGARKITIACAT